MTDILKKWKSQTYYKSWKTVTAESLHHQSWPTSHVMPNISYVNRMIHLGSLHIIWRHPCNGQVTRGILSGSLCQMLSQNSDNCIKKGHNFSQWANKLEVNINPICMNKLDFRCLSAAGTINSPYLWLHCADNHLASFSEIEKAQVSATPHLLRLV